MEPSLQHQQQYERRAGAGKPPRRQATCTSCCHYHEQPQDGGLNYPWLVQFHRGIHGPLVRAEFEEPATDTLNWTGREYNEHWWSEHCAVASHVPGYLLREHMRFYVNRGHPINIRYIFSDGYVVQSPTPSMIDRHDDRRFKELSEMYALEEGWFARNDPSGGR